MASAQIGLLDWCGSVNSGQPSRFDIKEAWCFLNTLKVNFPVFKQGSENDLIPFQCFSVSPCLCAAAKWHSFFSESHQAIVCQ